MVPLPLHSNYLKPLISRSSPAFLQLQPLQISLIHPLGQHHFPSHPLGLHLLNPSHPSHLYQLYLLHTLPTSRFLPPPLPLPDLHQISPLHHLTDTQQLLPHTLGLHLPFQDTLQLLPPLGQLHLELIPCAPAFNPASPNLDKSLISSLPLSPQMIPLPSNKSLPNPIGARRCKRRLTLFEHKGHGHLYICLPLPQRSLAPPGSIKASYIVMGA